MFPPPLLSSGLPIVLLASIVVAWLRSSLSSTDDLKVQCALWYSGFLSSSVPYAYQSVFSVQKEAIISARRSIAASHHRLDRWWQVFVNSYKQFMLTTPAPRQLRSLGDEDLAVYVATRNSIIYLRYLLKSIRWNEHCQGGRIGGW